LFRSACRRCRCRWSATAPPASTSTTARWRSRSWPGPAPRAHSTSPTAWACWSSRPPKASSTGTACARRPTPSTPPCASASRPWSPLTEVFVLQPHVVAGAVVQALDLGVGEQTQPACGAAHPQLALAHGLARRHQRAGAHERMLADHRAVQDQRAHADQGGVADGAGVDHRLVADGHVLADDRRVAIQAGVRAGVADVDHAAVLDVRPRADAHVVDVAAHHGPGPDRNVVSERHVTDHRGGRIDVDALAERGNLVAIGTDIHRHRIPRGNAARLRGWTRLRWRNCGPPWSTCAKPGMRSRPIAPSAWTTSPACATPSSPACRTWPPPSPPTSATAPPTNRCWPTA